ncbi:MAG: prolyl oligopeptidase family serine peptidase [Bacteroidales bacterium]|nr:prolyl oligopeptidase family serine peptidase [Bacteroidales bacterium]
MKSFFFMLCGMMCFFTANPQKIEYPSTRMADHYETFFGVEVNDPYRWLEDENSDETRQWIEQQNKITFSFLSSIPFRDKIRERLVQLWNYEKRSLPWRKKDLFFYFKNDGLQNQSVLYIRRGDMGEEKVLLDPNSWSKDGTIALNQTVVSHDAKYLAYSFSHAGSDWQEIKVIDLVNNKELKDHLRGVKFSTIAWYKKGFFYSAYDSKDSLGKYSKKNEYHKVFYHQLGTDQAKDKLIYENRSYPLRNYQLYTDDDGKYFFLTESESTSGNALYFKKASFKKDGSWIKLADGFDYDYDIVEVIGDKLYVLTNENAPNKKLIEIDLKNPDRSAWKTFIPEKPHVIQFVAYAFGKWLVVYLENASSKLYLFNEKGEIQKNIDLGIGSVGGISSEKNNQVAYFSFSSFAVPPRIYSYDVIRDEMKVFWESKVDFRPEDFETYQVFYSSKDGTIIPMFITHKKDLDRNGDHPVLLYGYGGFNISLTPAFRVSIIPFLESGGIYCVPNLRGGGEFGEKWHQGGMRHNKQNVFDDFISAAEFLIKENYTRPERIAIQGGSNGGLLVGACMTQRPDLFRVALPAVGVLDMLRFHKFTIGWAWINEYGSPEKEEDFHYLLKYSPYHNIRPDVEYPATLVTTADHDDRVVPAHSYKFIARLQACQAADNPVLIRIETKAGHGAGKPTSKQIEEATDILSFMMYYLKMEPGW